MSKKDVLEFNILTFLVLYMPFHYIICEIVLKMTNIDNIIRDVIIILLFFFHIYKKGLRLNSNGLIIAFIWLIMFLFMIISLLQGNYYSINMFRTYAIPCLLYFVVKDVKVEKDKLTKLINVSLIEICLVGIWGIFQAFVLGDDFLVRIGYPTVNGYLGASFYINGYYGIQRSVGTFVSANYCGLIIAIFAILSILIDYKGFAKINTFLIIMIIAGMLGTISRSAILSFVLSLCYCFFICERKLSEKLVRNLLFIVIIGGVILFTFDNICLNGILTRMLQDALSAALSFSDSSSQKHLSDLTDPIQIIITHPFGLGFGSNGPMALSQVLNSNNVESSIYLMMYELGPILGAIYFIPFIVCIIKAPSSNNWIKKTSATIICLIMITFIFLPNVQCFEILFYLYIALGVFENKHIASHY